MRHLAIAIGIVTLCACHTPRSAAGRAEILPLRTLRLYETGVGYFARSGQLDGASSMSLPVPASHLDDALKTLVVLSGDNKSRIEGVEFASSVSRGMARALAGLPKAADSAIGWRDLLTSLTGAAVELRARSETVRGRIVDIADGAPLQSHTVKLVKAKGKDADAGDDAAGAPDFLVLVLTERGEVRRFASSELVAVRPLDEAFAPRLGSALDALSTRAAQTEHAIRLLAHAAGPVTLGYIAETPLYRTTWRLVLDPAGKATTLVGWALLHNDTDEEWRQIKVELVNGQPDSFLFPIAAPRYARRPLVHPEAELSTVPQLLDQTSDSIWGDHALDDGEATVMGGLSGTSTGEAYGFGSGRGMMGIGRGGGGGGVSSSTDIAVGNLAGVEGAKGLESGALFTYTLAEPLDLRGHGSALVPFLQQTVDAQPITWIASEGEPARSAVRLVNNTGQTLPAGPIAFFDAGGFAGEAALDRLKPGERRVLQHGNDLDVELTVDEQSQSEATRRVRFAHGRLEEHFLRTREVTYAIENRSGAPKSVLLGLKLDNNAKVTGADRLDYDSVAARPVAAFDVAARDKAKRKLVTVEGLSRRSGIDELSVAHLEELAALADLPAPARAPLAEAARLAREIEALQRKIDRQKSDIAEVDGDLTRLRGHLAAMGDKGGAAPANPFVQRILAGEDKLAELRRGVEASAATKKLRAEAMKSSLEKIPG